MPEEGARLTSLGKVISALLIVGLLGLGVWVVIRKNQPRGGAPGAPGAEGPQTEAPDASGVTTVKEYKYIPGDRLPPVKGASQYKWTAGDKAVRRAYNVWAGGVPGLDSHGGTGPTPGSGYGPND